MKKRFIPLLGPKTEREIVNFGDARLVTALNGRLELRGGSPDDRTAAKEWISLFMHDAIVRFV